jgi:hypothetical protein
MTLEKNIESSQICADVNLKIAPDCDDHQLLVNLPSVGSKSNDSWSAAEKGRYSKALRSKTQFVSALKLPAMSWKTFGRKATFVSFPKRMLSKNQEPCL